MRTTPTLPGYVAFLYGVVRLPPANLPTAQGTATAGSLTTLTDGSQSWSANQWAPTGYPYGVGDTTQGQAALIAANTTNTLNWTEPLAQPIQAGDAYLIAPEVVFASFEVALDIVNEQILAASSSQYALAVYNLAADRLLNYAPDLPEQTYFSDQRGKDKLSLTSVSVGVPSAVNDQGTSVGILNPEQMKLFTLADLQCLKTPYGRAYMGIAQSVGMLWGIT